MILLKKRAHLLLKAPLPMVRLLPVDVPHQRAEVRRSHREQSIPALPRKTHNTLILHPGRRRSLQLRHNLCRGLRRSEPQRKMHMIGNTAHTETFTIEPASSPGQIRMEVWPDLVVNQRRPFPGAEDDMHQIQIQRLRHVSIDVPGLRPSLLCTTQFLGLRPRLLCVPAIGPDPSFIKNGLPRLNHTNSVQGRAYGRMEICQ